MRGTKALCPGAPEQPCLVSIVIVTTPGGKIILSYNDILNISHIKIIYVLIISSTPNWHLLSTSMGFPGGSVVKSLLSNSGDKGDMGSIPGSERSPGGENDNTLQFSWLENHMDRGAWRAYSPWGHRESETTGD